MDDDDKGGAIEAAVFPLEMQVTDNMVVLQGSPPKSPIHAQSRLKRKVQREKMLASTSSRPAKKVVEDSSDLSFPQTPLALTIEPPSPLDRPSDKYVHFPPNLHSCGSAPTLPLSSGVSNLKRKKQSSLNPLKVRNQPAALTQMLDEVNLGGKYVYNSEAYLRSVDKLRAEYESTISVLKKRTSEFEKQSNESLKEKRRNSKLIESYTKENLFLKTRVTTLQSKSKEQNALLLQQKQAFTKLSQRYMSVNEALQGIAFKFDKKDGENDNHETNDKGVKAALRSFAKENQECHRRIKALETTNKATKQSLSASEKKVAQLLSELSETKLLLLASENSDTTDAPISENLTQNATLESLDPRLLRVLRSKDPNFDISNAVDLSMKMKQWYTTMLTLCSSGDPFVVMKRIYEFISNALKCESVKVFAVDKKKQQLVPLATDMEELPLAIDKGIPGHVVSSGKPYQTSNPKQDPIYFNSSSTATEKVYDTICFPVFDDNQEVVAVIEVSNTADKNGFSTNDEALLSVISVQIGTLIADSQSADMVRSLQSKAISLAKLPARIFKDNQDPSLKPNINNLINRMERETMDLAGVKKGQIFVLEKDKAHLWYLAKEIDRECNEHIVRQRCSVMSGLCGQVSRTGQGLILTNPAEEASYNGTIDLATGAAMGLFVVPILSWNNQVVGVLQASRKLLMDSKEESNIEGRQRRMDDAQFELLDILATQISTVIVQYNCNLEASSAAANATSSSQSSAKQKDKAKHVPQY